MFWPDVIVLKQFYSTALGQVASTHLSDKIQQCWGDSLAGEVVLGIGYTTQYLNSFTKKAERVIALMPAQQGAHHWPAGGKNSTFLADEAEIPLPDESVSRVLLVHACENTEQLRHMMREVWRILAPGGHIIAVVPNRRGAWARAPHSPFAHGSPFSSSQFKAVLREHRFTPYEMQYVLFTPPTRREWILKLHKPIEWIGSRFFRGFGGLIVMEAEKQLFAMSKKPATKRRGQEVYKANAQPALSCKPHG